MKRSFPALLLAFTLLASAASGADVVDVEANRVADERLERDFGGLFGLFSRDDTPAANPRAPQLDPKRIINDSNGFLKQREPETTAEEYAVYEKVVTMLTTNPELALKMLEAMTTEKEAPSPAFELVLGNAYYAANQPELAEQRYLSAVKRYPDFLRAWNNLGILYYSGSRFADATRCLSKAVQLGDRDPATFGLLGYSLEKEGDVVAAEMAYLQALSGDPANPDWREGLLRIYIAGKQFGRAEPLARQLIRARPAESRYWLDYATILLAQRRKTEAMIVLEQAVAAGAARVDELALLGDLYAELNLATEAVALYRRVLAAAPARGEQKLLLFARVLVASGQLEEAERTLATITGEPTPAGCIALAHARADLLMARRDWSGARKQVNALLDLAPLDGRALLMLGRTWLEENEPARATLAFEAAVRIPGAAYQASLELANLALKERQYAKTVAYLERALGIERTEAVESFLTRVRTLLPSDASAGPRP